MTPRPAPSCSTSPTMPCSTPSPGSSALAVRPASPRRCAGRHRRTDPSSPSTSCTSASTRSPSIPAQSTGPAWWWLPPSGECCSTPPSVPADLGGTGDALGDHPQNVLAVGRGPQRRRLRRGPQRLLMGRGPAPARRLTWGAWPQHRPRGRRSPRRRNRPEPSGDALAGAGRHRHRGHLRRAEGLDQPVRQRPAVVGSGQR